MDLSKMWQNIKWSKSDWPLPPISNHARELLKECSQLPGMEISNDIEEVIRKSEAFPVEHPVESVRVEKLKESRSEDVLKKNIASTYPIMHERVLRLIAEFIVHKREFGSSIEQALYRDMTVPAFIDRLLQKRAVAFHGSNDRHKLITGETGSESWTAVGTPRERPPFTLENCLSYDEIKVSALLGVSGHTECVNDGRRQNEGRLDEGDIETHAVVIGVVGPRLNRMCRMDYEDMVVSAEQNASANGYGPNGGDRRHYRRMWEDFYQIDSLVSNEVFPHMIGVPYGQKRYQVRFLWVRWNQAVFDNLAYHRRLSLVADAALLEASRRAAEENRLAFLNVIGCGLGAWRISSHQKNVFVLSFLERITTLMNGGHIDNVSDVNFAYIDTDHRIEVFQQSKSENQRSTEKLFLRCEDHPKGGINVQLQDREPSSRLSGEHEGKLLVMTYPWNGNAHPGNEFWLEKLGSSGNSAAACSTQISELHNAHVNDNVRADNSRIATNAGIQNIRDYARHID